MDPVIMLPGLGSDAAVWMRTIQDLGPNYDCRVGDTLSDSSLVDMAHRVLKDAPDKFALAGVSMGGMVAITIMGLAPDRVTRLALFDTNSRLDTLEQITRRHSANAAMLAATDLRTVAGPSIAYMVHPQAGNEVRDALADMTVRVGAEAYVRQNLAVAARTDLTPLLANIGVPTLVAVGANDLMTPISFAERIAEAISGAVLRIIPECGHLPPHRKAHGDSSPHPSLATHLSRRIQMNWV